MALLDDPLVGLTLTTICIIIAFQSKGYVRKIANALGMLILLGMILSKAKSGPEGPRGHMGAPGMPGRDCECTKQKQHELIVAVLRQYLPELPPSESAKVLEIEPPPSMAMEEDTIAKLKGLSEKIQKDYIEKYAQ